MQQEVKGRKTRMLYQTAVMLAAFFRCGQQELSCQAAGLWNDVRVYEISIYSLICQAASSI